MLDDVPAVDSSIPPPPPSRSLYRQRPWYLVAAMVLAFFAGAQGMTTGCSNAMFLREGRVPDVAAAAQAAKSGLDVMDFAALIRAAELSSMFAHRHVAFPLGIAEAMLGGLMVLASGMAMGGRKGARSLAIQALAANALFAIAAFTLTRGMRAGWIEVVTRAAEALPPGSPQRGAFANGQALVWVTRIKLGFFDLGPLALGLLALTRARTRSFFDAVARAVERAEDP